MGQRSTVMENTSFSDMVRQTQEFKGDGLFAFVLERAAKHIVEKHTKTSQLFKTPSPFDIRIMYEKIIGAAFHRMWQEKKEREEKQRMEDDERKRQQEAEQEKTEEADGEEERGERQVVPKEAGLEQEVEEDEAGDIRKKEEADGRGAGNTGTRR